MENEPIEGVGGIRRETFRSGGPGGQHQNTTDSGVRLRVEIVDPELLDRLREMFPSRINKEGELLVESREEREQPRNQAIAYARLREIIEEAKQVPKERIKTKPTRAARERRIDEKKRQGDKKRGRQKPGDW